MNLPDFSFEKELWNAGHDFIAGADEVGRGAFAGPVYAAIVVFPKDFVKTSHGKSKSKVVIDDSKKLTQKRRIEAYDWIKDNALKFGIGDCPVTKINNLGIVKATHIAYRKALQKVSQDLSLHWLLVDAFPIPHLPGIGKKHQTAIIKGDQKSFSIAAASIIAKVERDNYMTRLAEKFSHYHWHHNKGYGTKAHRQAISKYGICPHHRLDFVRNYS